MHKLLGLFGAAMLVLGATQSPMRSDAPALEVTTSVAPVEMQAYQLLRRPKPGMYLCTVHVKDEPGSNIVTFAGKAEILLGPGETDEKTSKVGPFRMHVRSSLSATLDRARTTVTIYRDEEIIHRQTSTVWLHRPPA